MKTTTKIHVKCECHEEETTEATEQSIVEDDEDTPVDWDLLNAHTDFALENKAEFFNLGWAEGDDFIHSKTNKGRILTSRDDKGVITSEFTQ